STHPPCSYCDERDDSGIESVKQLFSIWKRAEAIVKHPEHDHHQHRRQNETAQRDTRPAPAAQSESHVRDGVTRTGAWQALPEREGFDKIVFAEPSSLLHNDVADMSKNCEPATESRQSDFEK